MNYRQVVVENEDATRQAIIEEHPTLPGNIRVTIKSTAKGILHVHVVGRSQEQELKKLAMNTQEQVDGYPGTLGDIEEYREILKRFEA